MKLADQGPTGAVSDAVSLAANDDRGPVRTPADAPAASTSTQGWDAFEVWRSRVRDPRRAASRPTIE
jgi:hypothetical protein